MDAYRSMIPHFAAVWQGAAGKQPAQALKKRLKFPEKGKKYCFLAFDML